MENDSNNPMSLDVEVSNLKREVDAMQIKLLSEAKPWYKKASSLIALFALIFSFGTTVISYQRTIEQDNRSLKQELRGLILQLVQLPLKSIELNENHKNEPLFLLGISGVLNQESTILADQSAVVAAKIPQLVTAAEYLTMANALHNGGQLERAKDMRGMAIKVSKNPIDAVTALRQLGMMEFQRRDLKTGREYYREALTVFDQLEEKSDQGVVSYTNALTEMFWAQMEANANQCQDFEIHIKEAKRLASGAPSGTKGSTLAQISETESYGCPPKFGPTRQ